MKVKRPELSLLKKIFLVDLIKGLALTFSYQRPSKNYTEQYPKVRPKVSERFRGAPRLNNDPDTGETLCIACNLCALACPEHCIEVGWERTKEG
jgi:NADH-quinone oxidoreductase subunit I